MDYFAYTRSLAPADFIGAVFTCVHFQKVAQYLAYAILSTYYITEGIISLMHFWLLMTQVLRI